MVEQCPPVSHNYSIRNNNWFHIQITGTVAYYDSWFFFYHQQLSYGTPLSTRTISSNLNDFYNPNLVESSICKCLRCAYSYEDSLHFFFHCQYYNPQRISLLRYINDHDIPKDIYSVLNGNDCRPTCISLRKYVIFFIKFIN